MRIETTFLRSKVARRIFFLFVSCALLPIFTLAVVSYLQVTSKLRSQSQLELQQASKARGMTILERLETLDAEIQTLALESNGGTMGPSAVELGSHFSGITSFRGPAGQTVLAGTALARPGLAPAEIAHLTSGKSLLKTSACGVRSGGCLQLIHLKDPRSIESMIVGQINNDYLWDSDTLPSSLDLAVFEGSRPLLGPSASAPPLGSPAQQIPGRSDRWFEWTQRDGVRYEAAYWRLFLVPRFYETPWTIVVSRKRDDVATPAVYFQQTFPLIVLLALWAVTLLSLIQIRRTLVPLEKLKEGTRQLSAQHFDIRVDVQSGDEFQELAASFNAMAGQLGKQFEALKTIHQIDQALLASLDRDGIVDAVLERLPNLLGSECCAIALLDDKRFSSAASLTVITASDMLRRKVIGTDFSQADRQRIQADPEFFGHGPETNLPEFLKPLHLQTGSAYTVFPIFSDNALTAALVSVRSETQSMGDLDIQNGRQIADQLAIAFSNVQLIAAMEQLHWGTLTALARAIDAKSSWTAGHSERVTRLAMTIGRAMGLTAQDLKIMHRGGLLHDIGKIGTPHAILDKAGKLTTEEMHTMREHVEVGLRILEPIPGLGESLPIVAEHHEWFDGSGYPRGLAGEQISLYARIFAVADSYDAMTSDRPYRKGLPASEAVGMIRAKAGTQFDPAVVEAFLEIPEPEIQARQAAVGTT
jgi:putative nucleotidyltransferase with HDIG domain